MAKVYLKGLLSSVRILLSLGTGLLFLLKLQPLVQKYRPDIVDVEYRVNDVEYLHDYYDFIIVGGGSAGAVVANRLSENPEWKVLLLEAGKDEHILSELPLLMPALQMTDMDWKFLTEKDYGYCLSMREGRCNWPRGKSLGGSSSINAMLYVRGNKKDYDLWEALGNYGWSYEKILPYFIKSEDMRIPEHKDSRYHGKGGYLTVEEFRFKQPLFHYFLSAAKEIGYDITDINGASQTGFTSSHGTLRDGLRCSTAKAFLRSSSKRENLHVSIDSQVTKILIDDYSKTTKGVEFIKYGEIKQVYVHKEVILSAGSIQSPQLLMLSGIGDEHQLKYHGIEPILHLPGVGENLQDHVALGGSPYLYESYDGEELGYNMKTFFHENSINRFIYDHEGPLYNLPECEVMGFVNTYYANETEDWPDIQLMLGAYADNTDGGQFGKRDLRLTDDMYATVYEDILYKPAYSAVPLLLRPRSRGQIRLKDKDPYSYPLIFPNYYTDPYDIKVMIEGARIAHKLSETPTMKKLGAKMSKTKIPGCAHTGDDMMSDEYLECQARHHTLTIYHPVGTCKMAPKDDPYAVVDSRLKVYGIHGLRVVDASIMPLIVSGNTNAPTIMIAEKASDMIKEDWLAGLQFVIPVSNENHETIHDDTVIQDYQETDTYGQEILQTSLADYVNEENEEMQEQFEDFSENIKEKLFANKMKLISSLQGYEENNESDEETEYYEEIMPAYEGQYQMSHLIPMYPPIVEPDCPLDQYYPNLHHPKKLITDFLMPHKYPVIDGQHNIQSFDEESDTKFQIPENSHVIKDLLIQHDGEKPHKKKIIASNIPPKYDQIIFKPHQESNLNKSQETKTHFYHTIANLYASKNLHNSKPEMPGIVIQHNTADHHKKETSKEHDVIIFKPIHAENSTPKQQNGINKPNFNVHNNHNDQNTYENAKLLIENGSYYSAFSKPISDKNDKINDQKQNSAVNIYSDNAHSITFFQHDKTDSKPNENKNISTNHGDDQHQKTEDKQNYFNQKPTHQDLSDQKKVEDYKPNLPHQNYFNNGEHSLPHSHYSENQAEITFHISKRPVVKPAIPTSHKDDHHPMFTNKKPQVIEYHNNTAHFNVPDVNNENINHKNEMDMSRPHSLEIGYGTENFETNQNVHPPFGINSPNEAIDSNNNDNSNIPRPIGYDSHKEIHDKPILYPNHHEEYAPGSSINLENGHNTNNAVINENNQNKFGINSPNELTHPNHDNYPNLPSPIGYDVHQETHDKTILYPSHKEEHVPDSSISIENGHNINNIVINQKDHQPFGIELPNKETHLNNNDYPNKPNIQYGFNEHKETQDKAILYPSHQEEYVPGPSYSNEYTINEQYNKKPASQSGYVDNYMHHNEEEVFNKDSVDNMSGNNDDKSSAIPTFPISYNDALLYNKNEESKATNFDGISNQKLDVSYNVKPICNPVNNGQQVPVEPQYIEYPKQPVDSNTHQVVENKIIPSNNINSQLGGNANAMPFHPEQYMAVPSVHLITNDMIPLFNFNKRVDVPQPRKN